RSELLPGPFAPRPAAGDLPFTVEVVERSEEGVTALRFRFRQPLGISSYRFFIGDCHRTMRPWSPVETGLPAEADHRIVLNRRLQRLQGTLEIVTKWMDRLP